MFVRGLAGFLLGPGNRPATSLPAAPGAPLLPAGLSALPPAPEAERWSRGVAAALATAAAAGQPHLTLACASWGEQQGALRLLQERYGPEQVGDERCAMTVLTLEDVLRLLSAAWSWDLPRFARLLEGPLLLDGLHTLAPALLQLGTDLLQDAASMFGWTVTALLAGGQTPPAGFTPLAADGASGSPAGPEVPLVRQVPGPLHTLAQAVREQPGDTLVMLSSRASAARLAGLLPGSVLLSSSLCPVHLGDRTEALRVRRQRGERVTVVATTLPPQRLGTFDTVWQMLAPLPHLLEALALAHGRFHVMPLTDVATPPAWTDELQLTQALLSAGAALSDPATQQTYHHLLAQRATGVDWAARLAAGRRELNYATLAAELLPRPTTSVPVFVPYDGAARQLIGELRTARVFPGSALRYAAWLTPSEGRRAVERGQAESLGWALIWQAPYDPEYGLARDLVAEAAAP